MAKKPINKKTVKRVIYILLGIIVMTVVLYLWAIFRPTGVERLRQESEEFIASVPVRKPTAKPLIDLKGQISDSAESEEKPKTERELARCLQSSYGVSELRSGAFSRYLINNLSFMSYSYFSVSADEVEKEQIIIPAETLFQARESREKITAEYNSKEDLAIDVEQVNLLLDHWERCLFDQKLSLPSPHEFSSNKYWTPPMATVGMMVILRAARQGDQEKVDQYLRILFPLALSTRSTLQGRVVFDTQQTYWLMSLIKFLYEMEMVNPEVLIYLQKDVRFAIGTPDEVEKHRLQLIQYRMGEFEEQKLYAFNNHSNRALWENFLGGIPFGVSQSIFTPLVEKNTEEMEAALLRKDWEAAQRSYDKSRRYFSFQFFQLNAKNYPRSGFSIYDHQLFGSMKNEEPGPYEHTLVSRSNNKLYMLDFILGSVGYALQHGQWPETARDLMPEYLPEPFMGDSRCIWNVSTVENSKGKPVRIFACHNLSMTTIFKEEARKNKTLAAAQENLDEYFTETIYMAITQKDDLNKCVRLFDPTVEGADSE